MNKRKSIIVLLALIVSVLTAGIMTGAISFNPIPDIFQEYWEGSIEDTGYNLTAWTVEALDQDTLQIVLDGSTSTTDDYTFQISLFNSTGEYITNSTRTIAYVATVPQQDLFTIVYPSVAAHFKSIDIKVTR